MLVVHPKERHRRSIDARALGKTMEKMADDAIAEVRYCAKYISVCGTSGPYIKGSRAHANVYARCTVDLACAFGPVSVYTHRCHVDTYSTCALNTLWNWYIESLLSLSLSLDKRSFTDPCRSHFFLSRLLDTWLRNLAQKFTQIVFWNLYFREILFSNFNKYSLINFNFSI